MFGGSVMLPWGALEVAWGTPRVDWEYISAGIGQSHGLPRSGLNVARVDPERFPAGRCSGILKTSQQFFEAAWGGGGGRDPLPPWARPPGAPALSGGDCQKVSQKCLASRGPLFEIWQSVFKYHMYMLQKHVSMRNTLLL